MPRRRASAGDAVPLSREFVLRAAIELADEHGVEAVSMRTLADRVGAGAMSLYHHFRGKDDLLNGMVDLVIGEFALPSPDGDWKPAIRRTAIAAHDALMRHPWAANLMMSSDVRTARLRWMDALLGRLREAGFSADLTHHAYHALDSHIVGFALWHAGVMRAIKGQPLDELAATFVSQIPAEYPYLIEHIHQHMRPPDPNDEGEFEFGLDVLLDGLERVRLQRSQAASPTALPLRRSRQAPGPDAELAVYDPQRGPR